MELEARAVVLGLPSSEFWASTPLEVGAFFDQAIDAEEGRRRQDFLNHALVAATLVNIHREKGSRPVRPEDFLGDSEPRGSVQEVTPEEGARRLMTWAQSINQNVRA
ncbi:MAG: hypothetical protein ACLFWG_00335 [Longimicrobiales bacterium]